jgi:hypothetical protein
MAIYIQCDSIHAKGRRWIEVRPSSGPKEVVAATIALTQAAISPTSGPEGQPSTGSTAPPAGGSTPHETTVARVSLTQAQMPAYSHYVNPPQATGSSPQPATGSSPQETTVARVSLTQAQMPHYFQPPARPYSLINVRILNVVGPPPRIGPPRAPQPGAEVEVPPWFKRFLTGLRLYMRPTGTIQVGGFQFDAGELSKLAGVPVREVS